MNIIFALNLLYAPSLFRHLKGIVDKKKTPGRFVLTGSQDFSLTQGVSESLIDQFKNISEGCCWEEFFVRYDILPYS
jgi:hypothetical protein